MSNFEQRPPLSPTIPPVVPPPTTVPPPPPSSSGEANGVKEQGKQVAGTAADQGKQVAGTATEQGKEVAQTAAAGAQEVAGEAAREIKDVARTATEEARRLVDEASGELRSQAATQTDRLSEGLRALSGQLQKAASGQPLEAGPVRDLAGQAGTTFDQLAQRLGDGGIEGVAHDVSSFARRRPGAFLAGAATLGFFAGRMLRGAQAASSQDQPSSSPGMANRPATGAVPPMRPAPLPAPLVDGPPLGATTGVVVIDDHAPAGDLGTPAPGTRTGGSR